MGALNNVPYVVMLAGAKSISEGGTALVFLANITPGLVIKLSSPYWFEKVSYKRRIMIGSILMAMSFILVATFGLLKKSATQNKNDDATSVKSPIKTNPRFFFSKRVIPIFMLESCQ